MKGTKTRTVNTLGMFDLFKGIGMATVILAHTTESYPSAWRAASRSSASSSSSTARR